MIQSVDLLPVFWRAYDEGWGYILGRWGQWWTAADQRAMNATTAEKWATARKYGSQWIGRRVCDCSGLGRLAFHECGGNLYHGSDTIWHQYVTGRCELKNGQRTDGGALLPADPVFKKRKKGTGWNRHHIGYYVGLVDGRPRVIEAKGTKYGVVMSDLAEWHETAHWKNVEYEGGLIFVEKPILRKGDTGEDVKKLQELLNGCGESLAVDGKFGEKTKKAVEDFQRLMGLQADGICGDQTWAALERAADPGDGYLETPETVLHPPDTVGISREDFETIMKILKKYGGK